MPYGRPLVRRNVYAVLPDAKKVDLDPESSLYGRLEKTAGSLLFLLFFSMGKKHILERKEKPTLEKLP